MNNSKHLESDPQKCLNCGAMIARESPEQLCPACLLANVISDQTEQTLPIGESSVSDSEIVGERIGRYKLLQRIGEGGCGVVYMAEQEEPVRRRVALKIIKLGMDTKAVIARFEAERQALAMMDHPNIAKVLDAGATDTGRPYFVMERVKGLRITDYCDQNKLSTRERLELFKQVCHAIQHAHQKGIIHRDIKPSNILVTLHDGVPVPKVIDFGIAKATDQQLTDKTVFTAFGQFIGTPAYMSPEQAELSGFDIDTRTDIYSLGVLLYELLTGTTPFDTSELLKRGLDEMRRTVREVEPRRPSTKLSTLTNADLTAIAKARGTESLKLSKQLKGDLDWIVMKALEKDRNRRYDTANGFARDIQRYLENEPVSAAPPSTVYRFRRFARKHRLAFGTAAAMVLVLIAGIATSTWQAMRAKHAEAAQSALRSEAQTNERAARIAEQNELKMRRQAEDRERIARRNLYAADLNLAQQALTAGKLGRARQLLDAYRPSAGQEDLRGFEWRYLTAAARGNNTATLSGHSNVVRAISISPDGRTIISGGWDHTVRLWETQTQRLLATLANFPDSVHSVGFNRDGTIFGVGTSEDVTLWKTASREKFATFPARFAKIAFSPRDDLLACGMSAGFWPRTGSNVVVWNYRTGGQLGVFAGGAYVAFSPDAKQIAVGNSPDRRIILYELSSGRQLLELDQPGWVCALAFSPDGETLVAGCLEGPVYIWDVREQRLRNTIKRHATTVYAVAFISSHEFATASYDSTIRIFDSGSGSERSILRGHGDEVWSIAASADGQFLASGSKDETVMIWPTETQTLPETILGVKSPPVLSPDGKRLVAQTKDGTIAVWDTVTCEVTAHMNSRDRPLSFSQDGRTLVTGNKRGKITFLNSETFKDVSTITAEALPPDVNWLAISRDLRLAAFGSGNTARENEKENISVVETRSGKQRALIRGHTGGAGGFAFSADGQLAVSTQGREVKIWELNSFPRRRPGPVHKLFPDRCVFSGDGRLLASGSSAGLIIWDLAESRAYPMELQRHGVSSLAFAPDGRTLASSRFKTVYLWNTATLREVSTFSDTSGEHIEFSSDGSVLALWDRANSVRLLRAPLLHEIDRGESRNVPAARDSLETSFAFHFEEGLEGWVPGKTKKSYDRAAWWDEGRKGGKGGSLVLDGSDFKHPDGLPNSWFSRHVFLPTNATVLRFDTRAANDARLRVRVRTADGLFVTLLDWDTLSDHDWRTFTAPLTKFAGHAVDLFFEQDDGGRGVAEQRYVDNVKVLTSAGATPTPRSLNVGP